MHQLTVYSCITGSIGDNPLTLLQSQPVVDPRIKFVLFTDRLEPQLDSQVGVGTVTWDIRRPAWHHINPRRIARYHKLNAHLLIDTPYSLWLDGAFRINSGVDLMQLTHNMLPQGGLDNFDLAVLKHPQRACVYQELQACIQLNKDDPTVMRKQVDRYRAEGYPVYNGMVETGCLLRRRCDVVREFNEAWWKELSEGSVRDQLSFNYVTWRLNVRYNSIGRKDQIPYLAYHPHKAG